MSTTRLPNVYSVVSTTPDRLMDAITADSSTGRGGEVLAVIAAPTPGSAVAKLNAQLADWHDTGMLTCTTVDEKYEEWHGVRPALDNYGMVMVQPSDQPADENSWRFASDGTPEIPVVRMSVGRAIRKAGWLFDCLPDAEPMTVCDSYGHTFATISWTAEKLTIEVRATAKRTKVLFAEIDLTVTPVALAAEMVTAALNLCGDR